MWMKRFAWASGVLALGASLGCGDGSGDDRFGNSESNGSATASNGMDGGDGDSADTGDSKLDVGSGNTNGGNDDGAMVDECQNVDILFVIDDSGSMADNQDSLVASFPGFVKGIQDNLAFAESFHVGVVTSDAYNGNEPGCQSIGSLVTQTAGANSSNQVCGPFSSGARFLDESEPMLGGKFACIGKVGNLGSDDEKMARAMLEALKPGVNDPSGGGCNGGFARQDSLLVIVLISDEDDAPEPYGCDPNDPFNNPCDSEASGGGPDDWYAELSAYKANIDSNVVVLSLIGKSGNACGAVISSKLLGFANRFGQNGFTGDVCAPSYDQFFVDALPVIDSACESYIPPAG